MCHPGGGVDTSGLGSAAAQKQLQDSKEKLEKELKQLKREFWTNLFNYWSTVQDKEIIDTFKSRLEKALAQFKELLIAQQNKLDNKAQQSQSKTEELNKLYEELKVSYNTWEKIKRIENWVHVYKGLLDNKLRENIFFNRTF